MESSKAVIWSCLSDYLYKDATFLAERLHADAQSDDSLHLLATCLYRSGQTKRAHHLLKIGSTSDVRCRYLLARCCFDIKNFVEAENILLGGNSLLAFSKSIDNIVAEFGGQAHAALQLLGNVYRQRDQGTRATQCYNASLKCSPYLWNSFQSLCDMGETVDPRSVFKCSNRQKISYYSPANCPESYKGGNVTISKSRQGNTLATENVDPTHTVMVSPLLTSTVISKPFQKSSNNPVSRCNENEQQHDGGQTTTSRRNNDNPRKVGRNLLGLTCSNSPLTPSFGLLPKDTPTCDIPGAFVTPSPVSVADGGGGGMMNAPIKRNLVHRNTRSAAHLMTTSTPSPGGAVLLTPSPQNANDSSSGVRRSSRLFGSTSSHSSISPKENRKMGRVQFAKPSSSPFTRKPRSSRTRSSTPQPLAQTVENIMPGSPQTSETAIVEVKQEKILQSPGPATDALLLVMQNIGTGYVALSSFDCKAAVKSFEGLLPAQYNTPWVLHQLGKAYYEENCYPEAMKVFKMMRTVDPFYIEGTVLYSTVLWMLRKEAMLSSLATELVEIDKSRPEAWCAMGNCFSLQRDYDSAIKFFGRAIQLDPDFVYAFTLLGHEYVSIEGMDKALQCFRNATLLNERHYNAWYGIAMVHYKQENYRFAELYFRRALEINPTSSVLLCHLAVVQHAMGRSEEALVTIDSALAINSKNLLCRYQKGSILFGLQHYEQARSVLEELRDCSPKEPLIYLLLGQIHREQGETRLAHMNFYWAASLDPKGSNSKIKEAISQSYGHDVSTESLALTRTDAADDEEAMSVDNDDDDAADATAGRHSNSSQGSFF